MDSPAAPRRKSAAACAACFVLIAAALFAGIACLAQYRFIRVPAAGGLLPVYALPPHAPVLRVFFLGNSYTFMNDIPRMVTAVAASDRANPVDLRTGMWARANITLEELWHDPEAHRRLKEQSWDYVVLQEHNMQATEPRRIDAMHDAFTVWNFEIRQHGARAVVYETWAIRPDSPWYTDSTYEIYHYVHFKSREEMQAQIDKVTNTFAKTIGAPVAPVGDYWLACEKQAGVPDLYAADGTHASIAGDYIAALLLYRTLTGHAPADVRYVPKGLSPQQAKLLAACVSRPL